MVNNYGVELTMTELRKYTNRTRNQFSRSYRNKLSYTNRTTKGRNGMNQHFTTHYQPSENKSLMNIKVAYSQNIGNGYVTYE